MGNAYMTFVDYHCIAIGRGSDLSAGVDVM